MRTGRERGRGVSARSVVTVTVCLLAVGVVGGGAVAEQGASPAAAQGLDQPDDDEEADWWYTPLEPRVGTQITFFGGDPGTDRTYRWDLDGDGEFETEGRVVEHTFEEPGEHAVRLQTEGPDGTRTTSQTVEVAERAADEDAGEGPSVWYTPLEPRPGDTVTVVVAPGVPAERVTGVEWEIAGQPAAEADGRFVSVEAPAESFTVRVQVALTDGSTETVETTIEPVPAADRAQRASQGGDGSDTDDADDDSIDVETPGFGVGAALAALVVALVAARRRSA